MKLDHGMSFDWTQHCFVEFVFGGNVDNPAVAALPLKLLLLAEIPLPSSAESFP